MFPKIVEFKVEIGDILSAYKSLTRMNNIDTKNHAMNVKLSQNLRVLKAEFKDIGALRKRLLKKHKTIKLIDLGGGLQRYEAFPVGWDSKNEDANPLELVYQRSDQRKAFIEALSRFDETEISVFMRGLRPGKDLPKEALGIDMTNCGWLIFGFDYLEFDDDGNLIDPKFEFDDDGNLILPEVEKRPKLGFNDEGELVLSETVEEIEPF